MRIVRGALLCSVLLLVVSAGICEGKELQVLGDAELDAVHARGLTFLIDANTFTQGGVQFGAGNVTLPQLRSVNLANSLVVSGAAQQGAFGVTNAVNSAVNMPINIIVLINSSANGGITINNVLSAIKGR